MRALLVICALTALVRQAQAETVRAGVVVATRVNVNEAEADALAAELADALRERLNADVVAGPEARRRLPPAGVQEDCVARPACVRDVGERLDSDQLLFLFIVRIGPRVQIDATWARASTGVAASRPAMVIEEGVDGAAAIFVKAAPRLLPGAEPRAMRFGSAPRPRERRVTRPVGIAAGISVAALAGGVGLALAARSDYRGLEEDGCHRTSCPDAESRISTMENKALAADILFGTAAAAAGVALIMYFRSGSAAESPVRISTDGQGAQVWLGGNF
jgi:hypothetical protein